MRRTLAVVLMLLTFATLLPALRAQAWDPPTAVSSAEAYLVNSDTGTVLYAKGADTKVYPASITKLTTALVVMDKLGNNLDSIVTVQQSDLDPLVGTGSSALGLKAGEQISVRNLMYGMLVRSGNDCAMVLARAAGGSVTEFVKLMNEKAKELGAKNTHYINPEGLDDPDHYTTPADIYLIAKTVMQNDFLSTVVGTARYVVPATNKSTQRTIYTTNHLITTSSKYYMSAVKGIKTGTTDQAGACLVSVSQKGGMTYYAVVMGGTEAGTGVNDTNTAFEDSKMLHTWALGSFSLRVVLTTGTPQAQVPLLYAWKQSTLKLVPKEQFNALIPQSLASAKVTVQPINLPASIPSPVKKGQVVCKANVLLDGQNVGTVDLVASESVQRSTPLYVLYIAGIFFHSKWFILVCAVLGLLFLAYLALAYRYNKRRRARKTRRIYGKRR